MKTIITIQKTKFVNLRKAAERSILAPRTVRKLLIAGHKNLVRVAGLDFLPLEDLSAVLQNRASLVEQEEMKEQVAPDLDQSAIKELEFILVFSITNERLWRQHLTRFQESYLLNDEREKLAKTFSFIDALQGLHKEGYSQKALFQAYSNIKDQFAFSNFDCSSYDYFTLKLKDMRINGIERSIINAKRSVVRLKRAVTPVHEKFLIQFYSSFERLSYKDIRQRVNNEALKLGLCTISLSTVKAFLRDPEIQNTYKPFRLGWKWAEDRLWPYLIREKPKRTNYLWQTDCTCLNFYVSGEDKKPGRRWICKVIDVKARKIIAHRIGKYETAELVVATLRDAIMNTLVIPMEINHDQSSAYMSLRMKEIEERLIALGSFVRISKVGDPKDRGLGEVTFRILQTDYWKKERGYLGDGVRSFVEEGRIDPKLRSEYYNGLHNAIWEESEFEQMINRSIENYNSREL